MDDDTVGPRIRLDDTNRDPITGPVLNRGVEPSPKAPVREFDLEPASLLLEHHSLCGFVEVVPQRDQCPVPYRGVLGPVERQTGGLQMADYLAEVVP